MKANVIGNNTSIPKSLSVIPKHKKIRKISPPMIQINATKKSLKIDLVAVFFILHSILFYERNKEFSPPLSSIQNYYGKDRPIHKYTKDRVKWIEPSFISVECFLF